MTPLTITVSPWNYCQHRCRYCVSKSNSERWKWNGSFDLFSPPGDVHLSDIQLRQKHGDDYYERMCPDKERFMNKWEVLDFNALAEWIELYHFKKPEIHIAGGEPLLRPDIAQCVKRILDTGANVTILTNGRLIPERKELLEMPIKWLVCHHARQHKLKHFLECIEHVKTKKHLITRICTSMKIIMNRKKLAKHYAGYNFMWRGENHPLKDQYVEPDPDDVGKVASRVIHFIHHDGNVYPCNSQSFHPIGNVYQLTYFPETAIKADEHTITCVKRNSCGAYQTARIMAAL